MNVSTLFSSGVESCSQGDSLTDAGVQMWEHDCGVLPVVDGDNKVVGIITDRDIAIAVSTRDKAASAIRVGEIISGAVHSCGEDDDVQDVLRTMRTAKVRRLPVVDAHGKLLGIISLTDLALAAQPNGKRTDLGYEDIMLTLQAIWAHRSGERQRKKSIDVGTR